jgi:hypothetical protein
MSDRAVAGVACQAFASREPVECGVVLAGAEIACTSQVAYTRYSRTSIPKEQVGDDIIFFLFRKTLDTQVSLKARK